jgi:hypothetical protein
MPGPLAQKIRQKYPGVYDDLDDAALEQAVLMKFPEYADMAESDTPAGPEPKSLGGFAENVLSSGGKFLKDTASGVLNIGKLGMRMANARSNPQELMSLGQDTMAVAKNAPAMLKQAGGALKDRYGGLENIGNTLYEDPVGVLGDVSTIAGLGAAAKVPRIAGTLRKVESATNPLRLASPIAKQAGKASRGVADTVVPMLLKGSLKPSKSLQREHGVDALVGAMRAEKLAPNQSGMAGARAKASAGEVDALLAAKDAERPKVAGYLNPAREDIPLGNPQPTMPKGAGVMKGKVIHDPGRGAYPGQIDPREVVKGLSGAKRDLGNRALGDRALADLQALEDEFLAGHPSGMSYTEMNALKRQEQKLADRAFRAQDAGNPINEIGANFHKGMATGAQRAIEAGVPEVKGMNARTRVLGGLEEALEDAAARSPGFMGTNPITWLGAVAPNLGSKATFAADSLLNVRSPQELTAELMRAALLARLGAPEP